MQLHGVRDIIAPLADQLHIWPGLLEDLANGRIVRKFTFFYMATWREPHAELAVKVQEYLPLPHHEDRDREMPAEVFLLHGVQGTPGYL